MAADSGANKRPKRVRSRVTTDARQGVTTFIDGGDKRSAVARRFCDLVAEVSNDLGGPEQLSEAQKQIVRRIASLSVWCESAEAKMADGEEVDIDRFGRTANSLRRLCEAVGLKREAKVINGLSAIERIKQTIDERAAAARASATDIEEVTDG